jgi:hypothetical protein
LILTALSPRRTYQQASGIASAATDSTMADSDDVLPAEEAEMSEADIGSDEVSV